MIDSIRVQMRNKLSVRDVFLFVVSFVDHLSLFLMVNRSKEIDDHYLGWN